MDYAKYMIQAKLEIILIRASPGVLYNPGITFDLLKRALPWGIFVLYVCTKRGLKEVYNMGEYEKEYRNVSRSKPRNHKWGDGMKLELIQ